MDHTTDTLNEKISKANGRRKSRIILPADVNIFLDLIKEKESDSTVHDIRVYPDDAFVPNSYKWRAETSVLHARRNSDGKFEVGCGLVDAHRPHGSSALVTINNRGLK